MRDTLTFREEGDVLIVDVRGTLTIGQKSTVLREVLQELEAAGYVNILLNMADVRHVDRLVIHYLVIASASLACASGGLKLLNLTSSVKNLFRDARVDSMFEAYDEEEEAILSFYSANRMLPESVVR